MKHILRRKATMSPRTRHTLGQRLIRELVMWIAAAVVTVIAMTIMYQVIMTVVVP